MNVLLTGSFGNVGKNTIRELLSKGHVVTCFDLKTPNNEKAFNELKKDGDFEVIWGDILNPDDLALAVGKADAIIHLAAIIPPLSERNPGLAYKVNVEGTKNLIEAAKKLKKPPKFVMASSISVFGPTMSKKPPLKVEDPVVPSDHYSHTKVECEGMLKESGLPYLILRLGAVSILEVPNKLDPMLFEVPLENRLHFVDSRDCATAFVNAVSVDEVGKIFLICGGEDSQIYQRDLIQGMFGALGLSMLPNSAFKTAKKDEDWFYTDWCDTTESQNVLNFQNHTFQGFLKDLSENVKMRRVGMKMVSPLAKLALLMMSPYYKFSKGDRIEVDLNDYRYLKSLFDENTDTMNDLKNRIEKLEERLNKLENK